ncbi:MAG TPA: hypothetical protein EYO92_02510 [Candidatus Marinimicrobia bacterium]|nr:hypothetical protein [Candidatus Neomarinimicrobiota bacterium]
MTERAHLYDRPDESDTMKNTVVFLIALVLPVLIAAQDLTALFRNVEAGDLERVRRELPRLWEQYPNSAGVAYLDAVTQERAEEAVIAYKKLIQNFSDSPYVDDAMIKVGEYLFARGLYTQASHELAKLTKIFPKSANVQRAVDLQINSLLAIGESDSANIYIRRYARQFPSLDFNYNLGGKEPLFVRTLASSAPSSLAEGMKQPSVAAVAGVPKPKPSSVAKSRPAPKSKGKKSVSRSFIIQVGAYGSVQNAMRQKMLLEQRGYTVDLWPINVRGKKLQAVQVVRFETRKEAEKVGRKLKSDFGYKFIVLERLEN